MEHLRNVLQKPTDTRIFPKPAKQRWSCLRLHLQLIFSHVWIDFHIILARLNDKIFFSKLGICGMEDYRFLNRHAKLETLHKELFAVLDTGCSGRNECQV